MALTSIWLQEAMVIYLKRETVCLPLVPIGRYFCRLLSISDQLRFEASLPKTLSLSQIVCQRCHRHSVVQDMIVMGVVVAEALMMMLVVFVVVVGCWWSGVGGDVSFHIL